MTVLPIVERELRRTARKRSVYLVRVLAAVVVSLVVAILLVVGYGVRSVNIGGAVLFPLVTAAFVYCLLEGLRCADALSEEKREGTLGLLFLTPLHGHDVVLGKFVAAGLRSFHGLLAMLPILATALVMGGVTLGEFWRAALVLVSTLLWALAVGISVSTFSREAHQAIGRAAAWLALVTIALPFVFGGLLPALRDTPLMAFSPVTALTSIDDLVYRSRSGSFWLSLAIMLVFTLALLSTASLCIRRMVRTEPVSRQRFAVNETWLRSRPVNAVQRARERERALAISPTFWLAARRFPNRSWIIMLFAFPAAVAFVLTGQGSAAVRVVRDGVVVIQLILIGLVAWHAMHPFAEARQNGALELILTTPLRLEEWLRGQWLALKHLALWAAGILALWIIAVPVAQIAYELWFSNGASTSPNGPSAFNPFWQSLASGYRVISLIVQLLALRWLGMWMGLTRKKTVEAFLMTLLLGWLLPLVLVCVPAPLSLLALLAWARSHVLRDFYRVASGDAVSRNPAIRPPIIPRPKLLPDDSSTA